MSFIYASLHFLRHLGGVDQRTRIRLLKYITSEQMKAVSELVGFILQGSIQVLHQDRLYFRERSLVLRQLVDARISLRRKRNTLNSYNDIIPRLLRMTYIERALTLSLQRGEQ